jgi:hypothetical protein
MVAARRIVPAPGQLKEIKTNGQHRSRRQRVVMAKRRAAEQDLRQLASPPVSNVVQLEAVSLVIATRAGDHDRLTDGTDLGHREEVRT